MTDRRVIIVTGAGGALGSAMVERQLADGDRVVATDVATERLDGLLARLDPKGERTLAVRCDVTDYASVEGMVAATLAWSGRIDGLVNNAGICESGNWPWELPLEDWHRTIAIDLTGVFYCCRAVLPTMIEQHSGRIVNISSIAGREPSSQTAAYGAAKAGVIGLTRSIARDVAAHGIVMNAITPASIMSDNWAKLGPDELARWAAKHPVGRMGQPREVAAMVSWLLSEECSFTTGAVFDLTGGRAQS